MNALVIKHWKVSFSSAIDWKAWQKRIVYRKSAAEDGQFSKIYSLT
jgi:hypothetical protein